MTDIERLQGYTQKRESSCRLSGLASMIHNLYLWRTPFLRMSTTCAQSYSHVFYTILVAAPCAHQFEKWRQPLTPSRRQHDTADGEELVFNLRPQAHLTKSFFRKTSCLFLLTVWTTYNIQIQLHSRLTLPNVAENIKPLGSKPERAPSCLWQHSGPPQPRTKPASLSSPTSVSYINFTSS